MSEIRPAPALQYATQVYYRPSGRYSFPRTLVAFAGACAIAAVVGGLYAAFDVYNPTLSVVNVLGTCAFGAALGVVASRLPRWGHVRSDAGFRTAGGATVLAAGLYASWLVWVSLVSSGSPRLAASLIFHPLNLFRLVADINRRGAWSIGGTAGSMSSAASPISGLSLTAIWILEAAFVAWICFRIVRSPPPATAYCESCRRWTTRMADRMTVTLGDPARLQAGLESRDFTYVHELRLSRTRRRSPRFLTFDHYFCTRCDVLHTVSVREVTTAPGRPSRRLLVRTVIDQLQMTRDEVVRLFNVPMSLEETIIAEALAKVQPSDPANPTT